MECRICLESNNQKNMISPCNCSGTSQWVHRKCIEKWIAECDNLQAKIKCMECHQLYHYKTKGLHNLYKNLHKFKLFISPALIPICFALIIIAFTFFEDNQKLDKDFFKIKKIVLTVFFWFWIIILLFFELYSLFNSYRSQMLLKFIKVSFGTRYVHFIFAIIFNYVISCYWYISFGLLTMYIYILMNLDLIIFIAKKNRKIKILKDLSKKDLELQELPTNDENN